QDDAGVLSFLYPTLETIIIPGDSIILQVEVANHGFNNQANIPVNIFGDYVGGGAISLDMTENGPVIFSPPWVPPAAGTYTFTSTTALLGDENPANDSLTVSFIVLPTGVIDGTVRDQNTSAPILARLYFIRKGSGSFWDSTSTSPGTGDYTITLPIGTYIISVFPQIPYPRETSVDTVLSGQITPLDFYLLPAKLLLMIDDEGRNYQNYYSSPLQRLGVSYILWNVAAQGTFPISLLSTFSTPTIIWYTGDARVNTLTPEDQDSLTQFLNSGGNLFVSGQNIGEEINAAPFYSNFLHAQFLTANADDNLLTGVTGDSISDGISLVIQGVNGAGNSDSEDRIAPLAGADSIFSYTIASGTAALKFDSGIYKVVYFAFPFEAIHGAGPFSSRETVLARILQWFGVPLVGIEETPIEKIPSPSLLLSRNSPNPFTRKTKIQYGIPPTEAGQRVRLTIYDIAGRRVKTLIQGEQKPGKYWVEWNGTGRNGKRVPSGIYFYQLKMGKSLLTEKLIYLRSPQ
ncbi:T9SS type A sorting domain-containing protein, partial [candidate division TA06 bacterium]|nr:T9SS type A sorting domain-containing protein [candidate division TA06 bacterium]